MNSIESSQSYEEATLEIEQENIKKETTEKLNQFKKTVESKKVKEKVVEKPYSIEQNDKNITVHFKDSSLSLNSAEKDGDGRPFINHSVEGYIYLGDLDIEEVSPYKDTGNKLVDYFLKVLNYYEFPKLQDNDIKRIIEKAKQRN